MQVMEYCYSYVMVTVATNYERRGAQSKCEDEIDEDWRKEKTHVTS